MKKTKSIFILSTGGTISMQQTAEGYAPTSGYLAKAMAEMPELKNADMPHYTVYEYEKPIDSANMSPEQWGKIGDTILEHYADYDGFVVLHGTDTMAYTASALSFMLENLSKPVILTGSQLPLFGTRNDARDNLINAIIFASHYKIPEVCIYFHNKLFRGNRSKKTDASSFAAFSSPNFPALGSVGIDMHIRQQLICHAGQNALQLQKFSNLDMAVLRLFPGISQQVITHLLKSPLRALVLETYGLGTAPEDTEFLASIERAVNAGMIIVNCSQCPIAKVKMRQYAASSALLNLGVVSGGDMTVEAALAKLFYLFSKGLDADGIRRQLSLDLRGELTI